MGSPSASGPSSVGPVPRSLEDNAVAVQLYADVGAGRRDAVALFLRTLTQAGDWEAKEFYVGVVAEACASARPLWLVAWQAAEPAEADAWLLGGEQAICWAWHARGNGYARTVADDAFDVFHRRLRMAEEQLAKATKLAPGDPTAWAALLTSGMGLGAPRAVEAERFRSVIAIAPEHESAHRAYLQYLCDKWHGSHDEMFGFARAATATAPEGSAVHTIIVQAHVERHIRFDNSTRKGRIDRARYFTDPSVQAEIMAAAHRCILSPHYVPGRTTMKHRSLFAFAFFQMGQGALARQQFDYMGEHFADGPWSYYGRAVQQVAMARRALGMPELGVTANERTALLPPARDDDDDDAADGQRGHHNDDEEDGCSGCCTT